MKAARGKTRKFRKSGRHAAPTQIEKAAQRAGRAAPAVAAVGAITAAGGASAFAAAAPASAATASAATASAATASAATAPAGATRGVATAAHRARLDAVVRPAQRTAAAPAREVSRTYTVHAGDTLSAIAQRFYGYASDWPYVYHVNDAKVSNPNLIYAGQVLRLPGNPPASVRDGTYQPRHASLSSATTATARRPSSGADSDQATVTASHRPAARPASAGHGSGSRQPGARQPVSQGPGAQASVTSSSGHGCTGSGGALLPQNYGAIVTFLTAHGYTGNAAAGIAGNIYQESGGSPESVGDGGGGLIGWTPLPGGYVTGNAAADLQTQLNAILTFNQVWAQYIPALNAAASPAQAADIYVTDFERAGIPAAANREASAAAVAAACGL